MLGVKVNIQQNNGLANKKSQHKECTSTLPTKRSFSSINLFKDKQENDRKSSFFPIALDTSLPSTGLNTFYSKVEYTAVESETLSSVELPNKAQTSSLNKTNDNKKIKIEENPVLKRNNVTKLSFIYTDKFRQFFYIDDTNRNNYLNKIVERFNKVSSKGASLSKEECQHLVVELFDIMLDDTLQEIEHEPEIKSLSPVEKEEVLSQLSYNFHEIFRENESSFIPLLRQKLPVV